MTESESWDGVSASKSAESEQNDSQTRTNSQVTKKSPYPSAQPSCLSMKSEKSRAEPIEFKDGQRSAEQSQVTNKSPYPPAQPSCLSMKSEKSRAEPIEFKDGQRSAEQSFSNQIPCLPEKSSEIHRAHLDSVFMILEEDMISFVKKELNKFKKFLIPEYPESSESLREDDEVTSGEEDERTRDRETFLRLTVSFLRRKKEEELADSLQSRSHAAISQDKLKSNLRRKFQRLVEGIAQAGKPTLLNQIYTDLHIIEGESRKVNDQCEIKEIEEASLNPASSEPAIVLEDIFKPLSGRNEPGRTVVTKGVAGIGKTVLTQKYALDWAENKVSHNVQFLFPFTFRELNLLTTRKYSLIELLHHIVKDITEAEICSFEEFQVVIILDGLDECRFPLDFHNNEILTDVTESTSLDVLLTNLIRGKLLPSARLWITTRPAAASQIPPEFVDMVTEVRGFNDSQKEEYFRRRFRDAEQADKMISHVETSRSLYIICHIPVFCWITITVLEHLLKTKDKGELPKTLTEMYIHFLVVQTKQSNVKYHRRDETDPLWNLETKQIILALGKLAFEQLLEENLIFYEADLKEYGIDVKAASVSSGLLTEIFNAENALNQERAFCFVHRSIQGFLAALYVLVTFINTGINLLRRRRLSIKHTSKCKQLYHDAVDKALQKPKGCLDMFVRFLMGLSLDSNQSLLQGLLKKKKSKPKIREKLVQYIKKKIRDSSSAESRINLLHCLNELNDNSLVEEIQELLRSGSSFENKLISSQWSVLVFILLSSQKDLDVFNLKKFSASDKGLLQLLPVVKSSKKSVLCGCNLSSISCQGLSTVLSSERCDLRELDLSNNDLHDKGVKLLSHGLKLPQCRLEILRLSGCLITEKGCQFLASALSSNPSHLRELDLSFNHPGESGVKLLSALQQDPNCKLETLKTDHCGKSRMKPSPLRYFCELALDPNTAERNLQLSMDNKAVTLVKEERPYPDHPERFDGWKQILCSDGLTGRCYWEVEWKRRVQIGVTYKGIRRKGDSNVCCIGWSDQSWSLFCSAQGFTAWHNNTPTDIETPPPTDSNRVAVYLDWLAGTVSFYCLTGIVSSLRRIHLHTFHTTFTEPLYAAFGFGRELEFEPDCTLLSSSIILSKIQE